MDTESKATGKPLKIVIIGPESTGKSTLCTELANHYQTLWCPEYAREYLLEHGTDYSFDDLLTIARGQLGNEEAYTKMVVENGQTADTGQNLLFIDTDMYVMKVWCEFVFQRCHLWILEQIVQRKYDLYLLCNIDLPWQKDELREYPDLESRARLFHIYHDLMINQQTPWVKIEGNYEQRLQLAVNAVDKLLDKTPVL